MFFVSAFHQALFFMQTSGAAGRLRGNEVSEEKAQASDLDELPSLGHDVVFQIASVIPLLTWRQVDPYQDLSSADPQLPPSRRRIRAVEVEVPANVARESSEIVSMQDSYDTESMHQCVFATCGFV